MSKILYVDDEALIREATKEFLTLTGFDVDDASSGKEALEKILRYQYDAVVSDYLMPGMSGIDLLKRVRAEFGDIPFILFTGKGREDVVIEAIENGVDFYVQKGSDTIPLFTDLKHKINRAIERRQSLFQIQKNEDRLRKSQLFGNIGSWEFDISSGQVWGTKNTVRFFGMDESKSETSIHTILSCIPDRDYVTNALHDLIENGKELNIEFSIVPADGSEPKILHAIANIEDKGTGTGDHIVGIVQDITEKKNAEQDILSKNDALTKALETITTHEEELHQQLEEINAAHSDIFESEQKYRSLFEENIVGTALHEIILDDSQNPCNYRFLEINPAFEKYTGLLGSDIIGKTVLDILPNTESFWIETYGKVALTGRPVHFEEYSQELDKYFEVQAYSPARGQFVTLVQDITERKQNENIVTEINEYYDSVITYANVPIIIWDPNFVITRVNKSFENLIGKKSAELIGNPLDIVFPPDQSEYAIRLIRTTLEGVRWETVEIPLQHVDGTIKTVIWNSATIYAPDGFTPIATVAQGRDVTHERVLELEKDAATIQIQQNIAKLAILNDGIRNPLTIISTLVDTIGDDKFSDRIQVEITRIDEMVTSLDQKWIQSEKILEFLRKHDNIPKSITKLPHSNYDTRMKKNQSLQKEDSPIHTLSTQGLLLEEIQAQLYSILDGIDAFISVIDMESYEVLYANKHVINTFGKVIGKPCYLVLESDMDSPCPFCNIPILKKSKDFSEILRNEIQNTINKRWFNFHDKIIRWTDGRIVRLAIATDVTDRRKLDETSEFLLRSDFIHQGESFFESLARYLSDILEMDYICIDRLEEDNRTAIPVAAYHNDSFENPVPYTLFGTPCGEVVGKNICIFSENVKALFPQDLILQDLHAESYIGTTIWSHDEKPIGLIAAISTQPIKNPAFAESVLKLVAIRAAGELERKENEDLLLERETRYRQISETISDFTYSCIQDDQGIYSIDWIAGAVEPITGYTADELNAQSCWKFLVIDKDIPIFERDVIGLLPGESKTCQIRIKKKNNSVIWIETFTKCIPDDEDKGKTRLIGGIRDITKQKRAQKELRQQEQNYANLISNLPGFIYQCKNDPDWTMVFVSEGCRLITGYDPDEIIGNKIISYNQIIHPDFQTPIWKKFQDALRRHGVFEEEYPIITKNGDIRWVWERGRGIYSDDNELLYLEGFISDITEKKFTQEALIQYKDELEHKSQLLSSILDHTDMMAVYLDTNFHFIWVNQAYAATCHYPPSFFPGKNHFALYPNEENQRIFQQVVDSGEPFFIKAKPFEFPDQPDRGLTYWDWSLIPVKGNQDEIVGLVFTLSEVTEQVCQKSRDDLQLLRLESFLTLMGMIHASETDLLNYALEISLQVAESQYAFIGLLTPDESEMIIHTWSKGVMEVCSIMDKPIHFPIEKAGIWGECIRNRRPFILNDYATKHPAKHGCPEGHVQITNYLGVPIFEGETIVAILAVANKKHGYSQEEVSAVEALGNVMWQMIYRRRTEEKLTQVSHYNRTLIETNLDPLVTIGNDGKILDVNTASEHITGLRREELIGTDFSAYFTHPDDARTGYLSVFERGQVKDYPLEIRHQNGSITPVLYNASVYLNEKGEIDGVLAAARDITEQKAIKDALYEQEERYRLALQATNDVIWDLDVIHDSQIWNESGLIVFGWADIVQHPQTTAWWVEKVHPEDVERVSKKFHDALSDPDCITWKDEYRFLKADGNYVFVLDRAYVLRDGKGRAIRMIGAMQDVTHQKEAEIKRNLLISEIKQEQEKVTSLINSITDEIWFADKNGVFTLVNPTGKKEFSLQPDEKVNIKNLVSHLEVLNPDGSKRPLEESPALRALSGEIIYSLEEIVRTPATGELRYRQVNASPVRDASGDIIGSVSIVHDITDFKQTEQALQKSREQYQLIVDKAQEGVWHMDGNMNTFFVNPQMAAMLGYTPEEMLGKAYTDFMPESELPDHVLQMEHRNIGENDHYERKFYTKQGSIVWMHVSPTALFNEDGSFAGSFALFLNITDKKQLELALQESEEKHRLALDATSEGLWDWNIQTNEVYYNPEWKKIIETDDIVPSYKTWESRIHPDDKHIALSSLTDHLKGRTKQWISEHRLSLPSGGWKWVLGRGRVISRDENGKPLRMIGTMKDITERRCMYEELQKTRDRIHTILEGITDTFYSVDTTWRFTTVNPAAEKAPFGRPAHELLGKEIWDLYPGLVGTRIHQHYLDAAEKKSLEHYEAQSPLNGHWYEVFMKGWQEGVDVYMRDISDRKQMEERLSLAHKKILLLTSLTRHDIVNTLNVIELNLALAEKAGDYKDARIYIASALEAEKRIERLIEFTRHYEILGEENSSWRSVYRSIEEAQHEIMTGDLVIDNQVSQDLLIFTGPIIQKVFSTLIENSVRHGKTVTNIGLSTTIEENTLTIIYQDNGIGISEEEKDFIFEHRYGKHTGVGLFIAREILDISGLSIRETGIEGKGVRFEIIVPKEKFRFS